MLRPHLALAVALAATALGCRHGAPETTPSGPAAASQPATRPASPPATLEAALTRTTTLSAERLRAHVYYLASDALEGRGPETAGLQKAGAYLTQQLTEIGLRPAFAGAYRQPFEMLTRVELGDGTTLGAAKARFGAGPDLVPYPFSSAGEVRGAPAFVGYGIRSEAHEYDDYAGLDAVGKVLIALDAEPRDADPKSPFDGRRRTDHARVQSKLQVAREAGAKALLIVDDALDPRAPGPPAEDAGLIVARISSKAARALLGFDVHAAREAIDEGYAPKSVAPPRPEITVKVDLRRHRRTVHNVAAVFGPEAAKEAVIIGAHYDHLGLGAEARPPRVHNGADDNASGTAAVLEVCRALADDPASLRRKVYCVFFAGNERGQLGARHFVQHPPAPMPKVVTMLNLDMVGRLRGRALMVLGTKSAPELEPLAEAAVEGRGLEARLGGAAHGAGDHTPFLAAGAPVLSLFTGEHEAHRRPTDDPDTLDYPGLARVGAVAADLVFALARAAARPTFARAPKTHGGGAYFGSIPEFGAPVEGVRLSGARPGSPAAQAGVRKGDVIVAFGGVPVRDLRAFSDALRRHAPGDTVKFEVERGEQTLTLEATLTRRQ